MEPGKEKIRKATNKKIFLGELREALNEIKEAKIYAKKKGFDYSEAFKIVKKKGAQGLLQAHPKKPLLRQTDQ